MAARGHDVDQRITWVPAVPHEQVPRIMSHLDVLVLPSRDTSTWSEQFGHVLIEAMAMGIPVVGSDSGAIPDVIGSVDLVFPQGDARALADILERLLQDVPWREQMGDWGRLRVQELYSDEAIAMRLTTCWRQVLQRE